MSRLYIHIVRIEGGELLERAFQRVVEADAVASCMIEPDRCQICFVAPEADAATLLGEIYREGGLRWSSRHLFTADSPHV